MTKRLMIQGTMSGVGKSLLTAALCRIFWQDGYRVAPFKSQNMALNSYITENGLEMGRAQVLQAWAAGREPDVRMNPILLKPSSDVGSQLIVKGEVRGDYQASEYFRKKRELIPEILASYHSLCQENDILVIEGAGSPAEINLKADDIVNMGLARLVDAPVLLVGDIDRGGVFAQLYGTLALLEPDEQDRVVGCVINKFRGDVTLLQPGLKMLEEKTKVPVLGVIPYVPLDLDEEDSLAPCLTRTSHHKPVDLAVIRLPRLSNFTDFAPLERHEVCQPSGGTGTSGRGPAAWHQEHHGGPSVAAPERTGSRDQKTGSPGNPAAGHLRRVPDAGTQSVRSGWGGRRRYAGRNGPAAL